MPSERDIKSDAILRLICQDSHTIHTAQGRSSSCFKHRHGEKEPLSVSLKHLKCCPVSGIFHLFFPPLRTCGINCIFWPDSPALILLAARKGEEERWECQRGSTQQLRVINHCQGGEGDGG